MFEVTQCCVIFLQTIVVVRALREYGLAEITLKSERSFGGLPCLFTQRGRWLKTLCAIAARINV